MVSALQQYRTPLARVLILCVMGVGISLFVVACLLEVATYAASSRGLVVPTMGHEVALIGWLGPAGFHIGWYANVFVVGSWLCSLVLRRGFAIAGLCLGIVATVVAASSYISLALWPPHSDPGPWEFVEFGPGIHVWLLYTGTTIVAGLVSLGAAPRGFAAETSP